MNVCIHCENDNLDDAVICTNCGKILRKTLPIDFSRGAGRRLEMPTAPPQGPEMTLMVSTPLGYKPVLLSYAKRINLGRADSATNTTPDIDFTSFGGMELGVSRIHAVIGQSAQGPAIADMGSTNGTFVNGKRLEPRQPQLLKYGDEVRLGRLVVYVYIQETKQ
jgi:FHA domain-containing protein